MTLFAFPPGERSVVRIHGSEAFFPIHRVYCVGRNFVDHALEMGADPHREPPFFFTKPADAVVSAVNPGQESWVIPYPPRTVNLHHEIELVVALGRGGSNIPVESIIFLSG